MDNLIVAASNLYGIRAILSCPSKWGKLICLSSVLASILYHVVEHHKHGMIGWGSGTHLEHQICINIDRMMAVILGLYMIRGASIKLIIQGCGPLILLGLSELPWIFKIFGPYYEHFWYIWWHSLWHIGIFHVVYLLALQKLKM